MAKRSAILSVIITGDASKSVKAFREAQQSAKQMQATFEKSAKIGAAALAGLAAAAWHVGSVASEAQQAAGAVESIFGAYSDSIKRYADEAAQAVGLSSQSYNSLASVLGAQMKNMGLAGNDLTKQTNGLIEVGADLAATFGGTTADAVEAITSLLRGERDPIERYGVAISEAKVQAQAAAMGLGDLYKEGNANAKMQATLALLTEQTASAQGQFARESDTAAGAQQRATAEWENAQAKLGEALLPILVEVASALETAATWAAQNSDTVQALAIAVGILAGVLVTARAAQIAMNIAMATNPVGLIITGLGVLIGLIVLVASRWEDIKRGAEPILTWLDNTLASIVAWFESIGDWFASVGNSIGDFFTGDWFGAQQTATVAYRADTTALAGMSNLTATMQAASAGVPSLGAITSRIAPSRGSAPRSTGDTYHFSISGALDSDGTARAIEKIMDKRATRVGKPTGGTRWR